MKNLGLEMILGIEVAIYVNKSGGCWVFSFGGKTYGAFVNEETKDIEELKGMLKTNAKETIETL